jgi:transcriptional regulator with XRE-family HTH domain
VSNPVIVGSAVNPSELLGAVVADKPTLTEARLRAVMSMNELADAAKVSASTVMDIERGARPRMATIRKLAAALGMAPQDIAWPGDPFSSLEDREND